MGIYRNGYCLTCDLETEISVGSSAPQFTKHKIPYDVRDPHCHTCSQPLKLELDYWIDYYAYGRRKREKIGPSRMLAEQVMAKRRVEIAENKFLDIRREQKIKFEDFADEYLELHCKPNNKGWRRADQPNLHNLKKYFAGKYLHDITPGDIERWRTEKLKDVSRSTVNRILNCLSSLFNRAVEWGKATSNPAAKVKLFKVANKRTRYLEREEIKKLLANCSAHLKPIVIIALHTGMRKSEILGLKWHDLDIKRNVLHVLNTKNGEKREVFLNAIAKKTLIAVRKHPDSQYIFCNKAGRPYANVRKSFFTACVRAGIIKISKEGKRTIILEPKGTRFRFHDLRHTFGSQLVMSGVDLNTVRELLGHKSLAMTLRYSHLSPDHKQRAVDILAQRMDTIWTPDDKSNNSENLRVSEVFENKLVV